MSAFSANAAQAGDRAERERAAKKACLSGDYRTGVSLLADLYIDDSDPNYIFNQGRCFVQNGRFEDAILRFQEYLRKTKDAGKVSDGRAEQHIRDCRELMDKAKTEPLTPETPLQGVPAHSASSPPAVPVPNANQAEDTRAPRTLGIQAEPQPSGPQPTNGRGLRIGGVVTLGIGVAAVGAGIGFALAANGLASELEAGPTSYDRGKESTRTSYATASTVGYAVGGVCIAGGLLLYAIGWSQGRAARVAVEPMVSARGAGALARMAF